MAEARKYSEPRFTYGDYILWPEDERWELIDGIAHAMTPGPIRRHQELVTELLYELRHKLKRGPCRVYAAPFEVRLPDTDETDSAVRNVVQPDISVICDKSKLDEKGCRGAPDFIIEILSPSSVSQDQRRKLALYEKHGVREYWIVDPDKRSLLIYRLESDGRSYGPSERPDLEAPIAVAALNGLTLDLVSAFSALD